MSDIVLTTLPKITNKVCSPTEYILLREPWARKFELSLAGKALAGWALFKQENVFIRLIFFAVTTYKHSVFNRLVPCFVAGDFCQYLNFNSQITDDFDILSMVSIKQNFKRNWMANPDLLKRDPILCN